MDSKLIFRACIGEGSEEVFTRFFAFLFSRAM